MTAREFVPPTKRQCMTAARKLRVFNQNGGICYLCGRAVQFEEMEVEHLIALFHGGPDTDANCAPVHPACHKPKTSDDAGISGHIRRLIKKNNPETRPAPTMQSRPFQTHLTRGVDHKVRPRVARRNP